MALNRSQRVGTWIGLSLGGAAGGALAIYGAQGGDAFDSAAILAMLIGMPVSFAFMWMCVGNMCLWVMVIPPTLNLGIIGFLIGTMVGWWRGKRRVQAA